MTDISKKLNISQGNISMVCNHKRCSTGGYVFMFYKEYIDHGFMIKNNNQDRSEMVLQIDLEGNTIAKYKSLTEASRKTGINLTSISNVCNGKRNVAGGYIWRKS